MNTAARGGRKLRVLLGDPSIDWDTIQNRDEHFQWIEMRDAYPAAVLQIEVVAKQRRALLVYGTGHLQRNSSNAVVYLGSPPATRTEPLSKKLCG